jgi:endogenous inhibitor of DNA gyrase (YacG/DUF329 family)
MWKTASKSPTISFCLRRQGAKIALNEWLNMKYLIVNGKKFKPGLLGVPELPYV